MKDHYVTFYHPWKLFLVTTPHAVGVPASFIYCRGSDLSGFHQIASSIFRIILIFKKRTVHTIYTIF